MLEEAHELVDSPRVLMIALDSRVTRRVVEYAGILAERAVQVELVVVDERRAHGIETDPTVRVRALLDAEERHSLRWLELLLIFRLPGGLLRRARRLAERSVLARPAGRVIGLAERVHRAIANRIDRRLFGPVYRNLRPWLLGRYGDNAMREIDFATIDRIIVADVSALALGWRLAHKHPTIVVTNALDRHAYAGRQRELQTRGDGHRARMEVQ